MSFQRDHIILVNEQDEWVGSMEKMEAHRKGVLHRAFSVFIMNGRGEMLIQQRAEGKYHSGGMWSNACCSHPYPGESTPGAAHRRLQEEMGFDCELRPLFTLKYRLEVGDGLVEHEYDHIYIGEYAGEVEPNPEEAMDFRYITIPALQEWMEREPEVFTHWFKLAMPEFLRHYL